MSAKAKMILSYAKDHSASELTFFISRLFGLDSPKDDKGHWYRDEGAPCPHVSGLSEEDQLKVREIVKALSAKKPKVNQAKQRQHENAHEARLATENDQRMHPGSHVRKKSYFTIKMQSALAMTLDRIRRGKYEVEEGWGNTLHLIVDVEKTVGIWYNHDGDKKAVTTVRVDYSGKDGFHIYPYERE